MARRIAATSTAEASMPGTKVAEPVPATEVAEPVPATEVAELVPAPAVRALDVTAPAPIRSPRQQTTARAGW
jgi:hypothetical protein